MSFWGFWEPYWSDGWLMDGCVEEEDERVVKLDKDGVSLATINIRKFTSRALGKTNAKQIKLQK